MSNLPISEGNVPSLPQSEDIARRAILEALRSRPQLTRPLFTHDCDDDPAIVFPEASPSQSGDDQTGSDDRFWADHRGWEL